MTSTQNTYQAIVITPEGETTITQIPGSNNGGLKALQGYVGGWIEAVYGNTGTEDVTFFINEEGALIDLPINFVATALWWTYNPGMIGRDYLRGVVVVTGGADADGETLPVPASVVESM